MWWRRPTERAYGGSSWHRNTHFLGLDIIFRKPPGDTGWAVEWYDDGDNLHYDWKPEQDTLESAKELASHMVWL